MKMNENDNQPSIAHRGFAARQTARLAEMKTMWPDRRIQDLFGIELPIIQAPMAGPVLSDMVIAVAEAGGLGSLPCATITPE
jgi:Nitronate monooxygenase